MHLSPPSVPAVPLSPKAQISKIETDILRMLSPTEPIHLDPKLCEVKSLPPAPTPLSRAHTQRLAIPRSESLSRELAVRPMKMEATLREGLFRNERGKKMGFAGGMVERVRRSLSVRRRDGRGNEGVDWNEKRGSFFDFGDCAV
jgi:hypothetical protein